MVTYLISQNLRLPGEEVVYLLQAPHSDVSTVLALLIASDKVDDLASTEVDGHNALWHALNLKNISLALVLIEQGLKLSGDQLLQLLEKDALTYDNLQYLLEKNIIDVFDDKITQQISNYIWPLLHKSLFSDLYDGRGVALNKFMLWVDKGEFVDRLDEPLYLQGHSLSTTLFIYAIQYSDLEFAQYLASQSSVDVHTKDSQGHNALWHAVHLNNKENVAYLTQTWQLTLSGEDVISLIRQKSLSDKILIPLLDSITDLNFLDEHGHNALWYALQAGHADLVKALCEHNLSLSTKYFLQCLDQGVDLDTLTLLISQDAITDVHAQDNHGHNLLWHACRNGHLDLIKALESKYLSLTALECIDLLKANHISRKDLRTLIQEGTVSNIEAKDSDGHSLLWHAFNTMPAAKNFRDWDPLVQTLMAKGSPMQAVDIKALHVKLNAQQSEVPEKTMFSQTHALHQLSWAQKYQALSESKQSLLKAKYLGRLLFSRANPNQDIMDSIDLIQTKIRAYFTTEPQVGRHSTYDSDVAVRLLTEIHRLSSALKECLSTGGTEGNLLNLLSEIETMTPETRSDSSSTLGM